LPPDPVPAAARQAELALPGRPGSGLDEAGQLPSEGEGQRLVATTTRAKSKGERGGAKGDEPFGPAPFLTEKGYSALQVDQMVEPTPYGSASVYPPELSARGVQGVVDAEYVVDASGRVDTMTIHVLQSDHPRFTESVRASLVEARFRPAVRAGKNVRQLVQQRF